MKFTNESITDYAALSDEERVTAFAAMSNDDLTAALDAQNAEMRSLFGLSNVTVAVVDEAEALAASVRAIEAEQAERAKVAKSAGDRFAALRAEFSDETPAEDAADEADEADEEESEEESEEAEDAAEEADTAEETGEEAEALAASGVDHTRAQSIKTSVARKVGRKAVRPKVATSPVTITAAADVSGFATGQVLNGMEQVTAALQSRVKGFAPHNPAAARAVLSQSGGQPVLSKFGVASFGLSFPEGQTATKGNDYTAYQNAMKDHREALTASINAAVKGEDATLRAAGWCAPSENVYSWVADFVVDGLLSLPQVNAPRGGLNITTGPAHVTQGSALDDFGFVQTESQAEAGEVKTCETIECPEFEDHRLDAIGYCYKIPLLTQKAYPELITDALRLADVLYAHKVNKRRIAQLVALSDARSFAGYGPSLTDSLEALAILATKERRKWNLGENAIMEVKVPVWGREVFRADMSRRTGLALTDVATDQKINAEFAARRLAVEYVADWQELMGDDIILPGTFDVMVYPAGTFVEAVEDVINLSAVYDAASLSVNEYTGVFFEQGMMTAKVAYGSSLITIPVNTAGETGAALLQGFGDADANGSF